jgi:chemotaxis protein MotA
MDFASIIGMGGGWFAIIMSIFLAGSTLGTYIDLPSVFMVIFGSYMALTLNYSLKDSLGIFGVMGRVFKVPDFGEMKVAETLLSLSERARREGILSLEEEIEAVESAFMKRGLRMVVDSTDPEVIRNILENELSQMNDRHGIKLKMLDQWAKLAPGFGMLGTVQGLIAMLKNLSDKSSIGPNMAVALITTFYGAIMANLVITPIMGKLGTHDQSETKVREMVIEGVLSIQQGDNPHILQMKLAAYLSPMNQKKLEELHPQS